MALRSYQLALTGAARRVSEVYGTPPTPVLGNQGGLPVVDIPYRQVLLQAETADVFIGMDATVTATIYGTKVDSTDLQPITLGPFDQGPIKLSDLWAFGTATLHILGIPF